MNYFVMLRPNLNVIWNEVILLEIEYLIRNVLILLETFKKWTVNCQNHQPSLVRIRMHIISIICSVVRQVSYTIAVSNYIRGWGDQDWRHLSVYVIYILFSSQNPLVHMKHGVPVLKHWNAFKSICRKKINNWYK